MLPADKVELVKILAGLSTIKPGVKLTPEAYDLLRARAARLAAVLQAACDAAGLPVG